AMDNATEAVKQVAKHQCPSNDEDGVLVTLDRLFPNT
ncbi:HAD hydrolase family protein, partial [Enterococcus faecium]